MKADFWRYFIMYIKGGIYADTDVILLNNIENWKYDPMNNYQVAISAEINRSEFCNWNLLSV